MKTAILMIALIASAMFALPLTLAATDSGYGDPDLDGDGDVDEADKNILLNAWGDDISGNPADLNHDGIVGTTDLMILLGAWDTKPPFLKAIPQDIELNRATIVLGEDGNSEVILGSPVLSSTSTTIDEIEEEIGIVLSSEDLEELDLQSPGSKSLVIAIVFQGPNVKGVLFEKKTAFIYENGERTLSEDRTYRGIVITSDGQKFFVRGSDMSSLDLMSRGLQSTDSSALIEGKANFHFSENANSLHIDFNSANGVDYKLEDVKRFPLRPSHGQDVIRTDNEKTPFWKRWGGFNSDREIETPVVVSSEDLDESNKRLGFFDRIRDFFANKDRKSVTDSESPIAISGDSSSSSITVKKLDITDIHKIEDPIYFND